MMHRRETPEELLLVIERTDGLYAGPWTFTVPERWQLIRIEGGVLAFFRSGTMGNLQIGVSGFLHGDEPWIHASCSRVGRLPDYDDLCHLHECVFGPDRFSAQMFVPKDCHVNIHPRCLHLWGPMDPANWPLPIFKGGTI